MSHCQEFDCAVVNDRFEQAVAELLRLVDGGETARLRLAANRPEIKSLLPLLVA
jgi:guanylate kinase